MTMRRELGGLALLCLFAPALLAQGNQPKSMGSIATTDARVSGAIDVMGQRAQLLSNVAITAFDHTAQIDLERGGSVLVCATSEFHMLHSGTEGALLFALDRGALEIRSLSRPQDTIITPDLRFTMLTAGPLDLRMRVTREGDTCVENRGAAAPVLQIVEGFGDARYHLAPGQHVLFEHGSLREVVDKERSNCGCPEATPLMVAAGTPNATSAVNPQQAAGQNPFPVAQSAGLAVEAPGVPPISHDAGTSSEAVLRVDRTGDAVTNSAIAPPSQMTSEISPQIAGTAAVAATPPPAPPGAHDLAHAIGGFFHRLFHRSAR